MDIGPVVRCSLKCHLASFLNLPSLGGFVLARSTGVFLQKFPLSSRHIGLIRIFLAHTLGGNLFLSPIFLLEIEDGG